MTPIKYNGTICIDFDGVIHRYSKGWHDGTCYDGPMKGAFETILKLQENGYSVVILSTRNTYDICEWLEKHNAPFKYVQDLHPEEIFWDHVNTVLVTNRKKSAKLYIDDRAYRFERWSALEFINLCHAAENK